MVITQRHPAPTPLDSSYARDTSYAALAADHVVVWVGGEQDVSTVTALSEALARAIAIDQAEVIVDLRAVTFMDAATAGAIVGANELLRARWRDLTVRSPSRSAARLLELCGLTDLLAPRRC
jgi:anti-anti-sigma factor